MYEWLIHNAIILIDQTQIIQKLCSRWAVGGMCVLSFIKDCMMGCLSNTTVEINILNVAVGGTAA